MAHSAAIRAGVSSSDADDISSCFVLFCLRRLAEPDASDDAVAAVRNTDPRYLLPLFLRCQVSRVRFRARRETTALNADENFAEGQCSPTQTQTERIIEQCAFWDDIDAAVSRLPILQRSVLIGYVVNHETVAGIGARHNVTESAISKALYRARCALKRSLCDWQEK
ncbi:MAG: sigma-70 family RNA polymerase sigma factor [Armatimonadetes bacterium]|nr:sigma-70 family RNA polymerase sigma factor [Armatimonadota bacterium]